MQFEWDETKNQQNQQKHHISFEEVPLLRCKNIERRLVVSDFKNPFSWTFDMKFYGSTLLGSRKLVGHLNRGTLKKPQKFFWE
jgi:hypothetical protein